MSSVHPSAIIENGAELAEGVIVGPCAYIGPHVKLGRGCVVHHHATIDGWTTMGSENEVFSYAFIGGATQDTKYTGGRPGLKIGNGNVFREYVSIHYATDDGDFTVIGSSNMFLAYSHVAHNCHVGDYVIMSSQAAIGGHVTVGDRVNIGWNSGLHQWCRVGDYAMIGACSKTVQDVPPYMMADGNPASIRTVNRVGMQRGGFSTQEIELIKRAYKTLYRKGLNRKDAVSALQQGEFGESQSVCRLVEFIEGSVRGLA